MRYLFFLLILTLFSCSVNQNVSKEQLVIELNSFENGVDYELKFNKGVSFYHPTFAIWTEELDSTFIESLYVTIYVAKGKFAHGESGPLRWTTTPGEVRRPATLPYWSHKRGIMAADSLYIPSPETAVPDALTAATPQDNFSIKSKFLKSDNKFRLLFEINQPWDSNRYWKNSLFPGDKEYYGSLQPALVYEAIIDLNSSTKEYELQLIGHSHPSGKNGQLFTDLSTFTTAKNIVSSIVVTIKN